MAKPSDYERRSEAFSVSALDGAVRAGLETFAEKVGAGMDLTATRHAVRTVSEPRKKGGFLRKGPPPMETFAFITDRHLAIAVLRAGDQIDSIYRLDAIDVRDFDSPLIEDVGLEITGTRLGSTDLGTAFVAVDRGPAGTAFRDALIAAARPAAR